MPGPVLTRFQIATWTTGPKPGTPVDFYRQGATASAPTTVPALSMDTPISVFNTGELVVGDEVHVGPNAAAPSLTIDAILSATEITVTNNSASPVPVAAGDRLIPLGNRPTIYAGLDATPQGNSSLTSGANAVVLGYIDAGRFDCVVSPAGDPPQMHASVPGGDFVSDFYGGPRFNVLDFPDVATALATIPAGARLYFPAAGGPYIPPDANGWTLTKPIEIFGDSGAIGSPAEGVGFAFFYDPNPPGAPVGTRNSTIFRIDSNFVHIHDICFARVQEGFPELGTGDGISFTSNTERANLTLERISVLRAGRNGLRLKGGEDPWDPASQYFVHAILRDCIFSYCKDTGLYADMVTNLELSSVSCYQNKQSGMFLKGIQHSVMNNCNAEANACEGADPTTVAQIVMEGCEGVVISGLNLESLELPEASKTGIVLKDCTGVTISGCQISGSDAVAGTRGIYLCSSLDGEPPKRSKGNVIGANDHYFVSTAVQVDIASSEIGNVILPQCIIGSNSTAKGQVIVPAGGRNFVFVADQPAGIGDNKGVGILLPSVPGVGAVDATVLRDGLLVFDSNDGKLKIRTGGASVVVGTQSTRVVIPFAPVMTPNVDLGNEFVISSNNLTPFTINAPTPAASPVGLRITIRIRNTRALGPIGAPTWALAYKLAAWTNPGFGTSRAIDFQFDGTDWIEVSRTTVDVPN